MMKRLRILIVEDHEPSRHGLVGALHGYGHAIEAFATGEEALSRLSAHEFDILLTDLHLPGISGFDVICGARRIQPGIRTIIITAVADWEVRRWAGTQLVDAIFEKPIELDELIARLESLLEPECGRCRMAG